MLFRGEDRKYWIGVKYVRKIGHFWEEDGSAVTWANWWYGRFNISAFICYNAKRKRIRVVISNSFEKTIKGI